MSCTEVEDVQNLATSFENLGRPPTTGITKLGRSNSLKNLAGWRESVGTFSLGTRRSKPWSSFSLKTLSSTKAASAGITKLGRSNFQKNLASKSVGTFSLGTRMRKSRSWPSLETLSSTRAASAGNNKVESKLVPSSIPQVSGGVVVSLFVSAAQSNPIFSFPPPEFCSKCCLEHLPRQACPCTICYRHHIYRRCPYESILPQGADFNRVYFTAVCAFDDPGEFDEEKWACTWCHRKEAKVRGKRCCICMGRHCPYECPKDVVTAAQYMALREYRLAFPKTAERTLRTHCSYECPEDEVQDSQFIMALREYRLSFLKKAERALSKKLLT
ncbi:variable lymphocyte receptor A diversity region [Striga asiatica]|uniref:Variable lymphocyte receptor A diversity region n=1 Tax=Striga asiatica TaxID=4170 RepID=A0A5A7PIY8_STRAF|nr:variable lymphocyte receptor A diversity region [Striga asiatica]